MTQISLSGKMNNNLNFEINLTDDCNLRCVYCSELFRTRKQVYVSSEVVEAYIAFIHTQVFKYSSININYFGGEPLMNMPVLIYITEQLIKFPNIHFSVITNGTMLSKNMDFFVKYKDRFSIQISYDGNPNHDKNRCNSSECVKENIKDAKKNNLNISTHSVICPSDFCNLYEAYKDVQSLGLNCGFVVEFASSYDNINSNNKKIWLNNLKENLIKIVKDEIKLEMPFINWFKNYKEPHALRAYCSAGINNYSLSFDGNIYKCHGAVYSKNNASDHLICSIFDSNLESKLITCTNDHKCHTNMCCEECQKCDTIICYNCHSSNYENNLDDAESEDYFKKWNSKNDDYICTIYKLISKYIKAYDILKNEVR